MVTIQYTKDDKIEQLQWQCMLPLLLTKPITFPLQRGFSGRGKKYTRPRTKDRGVSYGKIGFTTVYLLSGMLVFFKKKNSSAYAVEQYIT